MSQIINWISVADRLPPDRHFVMVTGDSGYVTTPRYLCLARLDEKFRPPIRGRVRWITATNDGLSDGHMPPTHWAEVIELPPLHRVRSDAA